MENTNSVNTGQAPDQATGQAPDTTAINETKQTPDTATANNGDTKQATSTINEAAIQSELKRAREEAAAKRVEAAELKVKLDVAETANAKLASDHAALQARATTLEVERAMSMVAKDAIYPDLITKQINVASMLDDSGQVDMVKITEAVSTMRATYPNMFTGTGSDASSRPPVKDVDLSTMSIEDYAKYRGLPTGKKT